MSTLNFRSARKHRSGLTRHAFRHSVWHNGADRKEGKADYRAGTHLTRFQPSRILNEIAHWLQGGEPLKAWDFVQERILSHDEDMISDFADDIDTLLVFVSTLGCTLRRPYSLVLCETGRLVLRRLDSIPHSLPRTAPA